MNEQELRRLWFEIKDELNFRAKQELIEKLKNSDKVKKYSYVIFKYDEDDHYDCVGFKRHNTNGYIDDHVPEEDEELYYQLMEVLGCSGEISSCTYELDDTNKFRQLANNLGLTEMQQGWRD